MTEFPDLDGLIDRLSLRPHPEGGYYRETWRSGIEIPEEVLSDHGGQRDGGTCIFYLLPTGAESALHRVRSDELWIFQLGDALEIAIHEEEAEQDGEVLTLGSARDQRLQVLVPAHHWQTARSIGGDAGYTLVSCVVVPGFDFDDFEMA